MRVFPLEKKKEDRNPGLNPDLSNSNVSLVPQHYPTGPPKIRKI